MADTPVVRPRRPGSVNLAALVLVILATLQVLVGSLFVNNAVELTQSITAASRSASPEELSDRIFAALASGVLVHAVLTVVYLAAAWTLRTAGSAIRIFVTMLAVVATLTDGLILGQLPAWLPSQTMLITGVLILSTAFRLLVIVLLWVPLSARAWYAGPPKSAKLGSPVRRD